MADELALMFTGSRASPSQITIQTREESDPQEDLGPSSSAPQSHSPAPSLEASVNLSACPPETAPPTAIHPNLLIPLASCPPHPLFSIEQLGVDRRLLVNRKRQLKMYRVWMQGNFKKLSRLAVE